MLLERDREGAIDLLPTMITNAQEAGYSAHGDHRSIDSKEHRMGQGAKNNKTVLSLHGGKKTRRNREKGT